MGKFYQCKQSYGPSFMTKFCSALYLENLLTNIFAELNLRGGVSCMPAALLLTFMSRINFSLSSDEHEKSFLTSGPGNIIENTHLEGKFPTTGVTDSCLGL